MIAPALRCVDHPVELIGDPLQNRLLVPWIFWTKVDKSVYDFPELIFVTRHGCDPWTDLAVKLMLKWPGLHYSTSAWAPKYYPESIIKFANTRGADKIIYAGYFPMGLSLERIMTDMPNVPFKDEVWPKFLRGNAMRVLGIDK